MIKKEYKFLLALLLLFGSLNSISAQDSYVQTDSEKAEKQATELVRAYQGELGMTVEQAALFHNKLTEFKIREHNIRETELQPKEKLRLLTELSRQETAEMGNILTLPQLRQYKKLKRTIQPIQVVVKE